MCWRAIFLLDGFLKETITVLRSLAKAKKYYFKVWVIYTVLEKVHARLITYIKRDTYSSVIWMLTTLKATDCNKVSAEEDALNLSIRSHNCIEEKKKKEFVNGI